MYFRRKRPKVTISILTQVNLWCKACNIALLLLNNNYSCVSADGSC